jgi:hypothetical protein
MTDDTLTARRELLAVLLSRAERGVLLEAERPLLRPLVEAEMATLDDLRAPATLAHFTELATAMEGRARSAEAAVERLETAARAVLDICGDQGSDVQDILRAALDGPSPTPDDGEQTGDDDVEFVATNDVPTDWARYAEPRCPARYTGPPPMVARKWGASSDYRCDLRLHPRGTDHAARLGNGSFAWADDIAVWPTDAPSEQQ